MSTLKPIYSYLIDRTQTVKLKGECSTEHQIKSGVPQGSLLGVLLFNTYLNDIFDSIDADQLLQMMITSLLWVIQWQV